MDLPVTDAHIMPSFQHSLLVIGKLFDEDCKFLFTKHSVQVCNPDSDTIITGQRDQYEPRLWRSSLLPQNTYAPPDAPCIIETIAAAFSTYDLLSVKSLVRLYHASAGFPVNSTWLRAIKTGNYTSWPDLEAAKYKKYCPNSIYTKKGHMNQTHQGLCSTNTKGSNPTTAPPPEEPLPPVASNEFHIRVEHIRKIYTYDMGRFTIRSHSGNHYIMLAYHCKSNTILVETFQSKKDLHHISAYKSIMLYLQQRGHRVELQVLTNKASQEYRCVISEEWKCDYQLVLPNVHQSSAAERAIRTFKEHFLALLADIDPDFTKYLWEKLPPQTDLTLDLLRQATLSLQLSDWEYFNGQLN